MDPHAPVSAGDELRAASWLPRATSRFGDAPAVEWSGGTWSWRTLADRTKVLAASLGSLSPHGPHGVGRGDRVAVLAGSSPAWACLLHAAAALGSTLVPLNARLTSDELAFQLDDAGVRVFVVGEEIESARVDDIAARSAPRMVVRIDAAGEILEARGPVGRAPATHGELSPRGDEEPPLALLYTSGTTGVPKGVALPGRAFSASAMASQTLIPLGPGDRWLVCMPLFHVGGLSILVRCAISGAASTLLPGFDEAAVCLALDRGDVTHVSFVATMLERVLAHRGAVEAPPAFRGVLLGGGPASPALIERAWSSGWPIAPTYGLTEACSQVATRALGDLRAPANARLRPLDGVELAVRGPSGRLESASAEGEICVRGPNLATGYAGHAAGTPLLDHDGWLATGDVGRLDEEGLLEVLDRRDDLIVSGGENVYPAELERVLSAHPSVREVAVVGREDGRFGARPVAFFVRADAVDDADGSFRESLEDWARQRLAAYKVPVAFIETEALPRTASGKIQRVRLRERAARSTLAEGG